MTGEDQQDRPRRRLDPAERRVVDTFVPLWNSLSLFRVPQPHVVSLVAPWAGSPRYSITGWFRRG